jgi:amidohydrolase
MTDNAVAYRRALHAIPELGDDLPETLAFVQQRLEPLGAELTRPVKGAVCAYFDAGAKETLALRADMDALPVAEATGLPFASRHAGCMHACGHDGHTAIMLASAESAAAALRAGGKFPRNLLFVFQPAEETTGGAKSICESGIFEKYGVTRIFGLHLWPKVPLGRIASRPGPLMARSNEVTLEASGKSVHVSKASEGIDALRAAAEWMRRAYAYAEGLPPDVLRTLQFGHMTAGTVRNAVAGEARVEGTLRTYDEKAAEMIRARLKEIAADVAAETRCRMAVTYSEGYPAVWNDERLFADVTAALGGGAVLPLEKPVLAAEDFSFYQRRVPGVFFFLGVGDTSELHSPRFAWNDEAVLPAGRAFVEKLMRLP